MLYKHTHTSGITTTDQFCVAIVAVGQFKRKCNESLQQLYVGNKHSLVALLFLAHVKKVANLTVFV